MTKWTRRNDRRSLRGRAGRKVVDQNRRGLEGSRPATTNQGRAGRDGSRSRKARSGYEGHRPRRRKGRRRRQRQVVHLHGGWGLAVTRGHPSGLLGRNMRRTKKRAGIDDSTIAAVVKDQRAIMMIIVEDSVRNSDVGGSGAEGRRSGRGTGAGHPCAAG